MNCLCDFSTHNIDLDSGICSKCGVMQPGNQICTSGGDGNCDILTSTPKIKKEGSRTRRRFFEEIPAHYVTASEGINGFAKSRGASQHQNECDSHRTHWKNSGFPIHIWESSVLLARVDD